MVYVPVNMPCVWQHIRCVVWVCKYCDNPLWASATQRKHFAFALIRQNSMWSVSWLCKHIFYICLHVHTCTYIDNIYISFGKHDHKPMFPCFCRKHLAFALIRQNSLWSVSWLCKHIFYICLHVHTCTYIDNIYISCENHEHKLMFSCFWKIEEAQRLFLS